MTERPGTVVFHRPARHHPAPVERGVVTIPAPPTAPDPAGSAVWQTVTPVLGSAGVLGFAVTTGELRHIVTAGVIAGVLVLSSTISRLVGIRTSRRDRQRATERYRAHLGEIRARLDESAAVQRRSVEAANPALHELVELVHSGPGTWERRPHHSDFLSLRLGTGTVPAWLTPELEPSDPMTLADPELLGEAATLEAETRLLSNVPIVIDLSDAGCVAVVADRSIGRRTAASLVAQLAALRSPAELTIAAHIAPEHHDEWNWIKWLPHVRASQFGSDDGTSLVSSSARELDVLLDRLTSRRLDAFEHRRTSRVEPQPLAFRQIVIVIDGYSPASDVGRLEPSPSPRASASSSSPSWIGSNTYQETPRPRSSWTVRGPSRSPKRNLAASGSQTSAQTSSTKPPAEIWRERSRRSASVRAPPRRPSTAPGCSNSSANLPARSTPSASGPPSPRRSARRSGSAPAENRSCSTSANPRRAGWGHTGS
jgi:DNA segregation ATPase FtsK/SpoIIIE-like protein